MKGVIINIIGNKGGIGKTTISCNLGAALAKFGKKTLVIDNDSQCNTTGLLVAQGTTTKNTIYELLDPETNIPVEDCIYSTIETGLFCLPNAIETSRLEMMFAQNFPDSLYLLKEKIRDYAISNYDYVLIDNPPSIGLVVTQSLCASDYFLIPNKADSAFSIDGLINVIKIVESVKNEINPDLKMMKLLINQVHMRKLVCKAVVETLKQRFNDKQIFKSTIPDATDLQKAELIKTTIFQQNSTSRPARAFRALAKEIDQIIQEDRND
jgi:chromosome partitioning protein